MQVEQYRCRVILGTTNYAFIVNDLPVCVNASLDVVMNYVKREWMPVVASVASVEAKVASTIVVDTASAALGAIVTAPQSSAAPNSTTDHV